MLTLSEAAIFSTSLEAIFYGFSVFMFMLTTKTLFRGYGQRRLNYGMIVVAWALLLLSTAEMAVNNARLYRGFISIGPKLAGGPEQYFAFTPDAMFLTKSCLYNAQTVILDAVMIYRAWVVWQNLRVIVIPVVGWCGLIATCFGLNISFARQLSDIESQDLLGIPTGHWVAAAFSLTLFTNLVTTLIIAYRIWMVVRRSTDYLSRSSLTPVLCVIVESGAIYSVAITAALITFAAKSNYVFVILDLLSPIISIVFSMIIVRVGLSKEEDSMAPAVGLSHNTTISWAVPIHQRPRGSQGRSGGITVEITETVHTETDVSLESDLKSLGLALRSSPACPTPDTFHCRDARSILRSHVRST